MGTDGSSVDGRESVARAQHHEKRASLEHRLDALAAQVEGLEEELERKDDRIASLEAERERLTARVNQLEGSVEELESTTTKLEETTTDLESTTTDLEDKTTTLERLTEATRKKTNATKTRLTELQARELEKGAHLLETNVDANEVDVPEGRLERITKADGRRYYRLPERDDPLARGGDVTCAYGELLPIQQLARMDEAMLRSTANALPTRLAAKLWRARVDPTVGDDPWTDGCKGVDASVKASDLKHWIRRQEPGTSDAYAKKLVSRTIDAILELSRNRLAVRKRTERKNGLEYTERRLVLPADVEIPGATTTSRSTDH